MDAALWFTQAKNDLDSANNDMHPITGKPAYEWVCYKCYRVSKYLFIVIKIAQAGQKSPSRVIGHSPGQGSKKFSLGPSFGTKIIKYCPRFGTKM